MKSSLLSLIFVCLVFSLQAEKTIPERERVYINRFLLPENEPVRSVLDVLFTKTNTLYDEKHFLDAGFIPLLGIRKDKIVIARHPKLSGFIIKTYLDAYPVNKKGDEDWVWLTRRCVLAEKIRKIIKKKNIKNFTVVTKWLYPLPESPSGYQRRMNFLLIEEEMPLVSEQENHLAWKTVSKRALNELADIMLSAGGSSYRPDNVWMTKNGTFAFIDTEYPHLKAPLFEIVRYLSEENKQYWRSMITAKMLTKKMN